MILLGKEKKERKEKGEEILHMTVIVDSLVDHHFHSEDFLVGDEVDDEVLEVGKYFYD